MGKTIEAEDLIAVARTLRTHVKGTGPHRVVVLRSFALVLAERIEALALHMADAQGATLQTFEACLSIAREHEGCDVVICPVVAHIVARRAEWMKRRNNG